MSDEVETTLVRNRRGMIYHRRGCYHARRGSVSWRWAEARSRAEIEEVTTRIGVRPCKHCDPLAVLPAGNWSHP